MMWMMFFALALLIALWLIGPLLPAKTQAVKWQITIFIALFVGAALGTYKMIGQPNFEPERFEAVEDDISAQIQGMVDGLAARLEDEPNDPAGWSRLIRSRIVMGDIQQAILDHQTMREIFKDRPDIVMQISKESGFDALAAQALDAQDSP